MKRNIKHIMGVFVALAMTAALSAQTLTSSYFLEKMPTRNQLNPAFKTANSYVSLPILNDLYLGLNSNVGLGTFLYPHNGELVTFLHESVAANEFLGKLKSNNALEMNVNLDLLTFGFWAWGGQNTFNLAVKSHTGAYIPKEIFQFLKTGQNATGITHYDMSGTALSSDNYIELALGHARNINDRLAIGARLKILAGIVHADGEIDRMDLSMSQDEWMIRQSGHFQASSFKFSVDPETGEVTEFEEPTIGTSGFGLGLDLGATYKLLDNLTLSASLTDIGFLNWNNVIRAETDPTREFRYTGFDDIRFEEEGENGSNTFENQLDQLEEDAKALIKLYQSETKSTTNSLRTTLRVGAEYGVLSNKISFGLLSTTRFVGHRTYAEGMASVNFRPFPALHIALNGTVSNMGSSVGAVLNICAPGFNFFIGTDYFATKYNPQFIPINKARANVCLGINFTFGKKHEI